MTEAVLLVVGALGSGSLLLVLAPFFLREVRRMRAFDERLATLRREAVVVTAPRKRAGRRRLVGPALGTFGLSLLRVASVLVPIGAAEREKLAGTLRHAGFGAQDALPVFLSVKLFSALVLAAFSGLTAALSDTIGEFAVLVLLATLAGLVIGSVAPEYCLRTLMARRLRRMAAALPDALDLMMMCLDSGLTFERSLTATADQLAPIERSLADELRLLEAELRLASDRHAVLEEYSRLAAVEGLRDLATTLMQSDRYGTPLSRSLRNIATGERLRRTTRITAQTERLPVLMTLPTLLLVVPGTMLLVAGPAFLTAFKALSALGG